MTYELLPVYGTALLIVGLVASQIFRKEFDPFAPIWLFMAGYLQIYVIQAISYHDYAIRARGADLTFRANLRALWALAWFVAVYHSGLGRAIAARLPRPPRAWSTNLVGGMAPVLIVWGLICSGFLLAGISGREQEISAEENLLRQFPIVMLVAGILLLVTGRQADRPRPAWTAAGVAVAAAYSLIWMFNGKRSHSLIAVLTGVCAWYIPRLRRPGMPVLGATAFACVLVVSVAIGYRGNNNYEHNLGGFLTYLSEFNLETILVNLNIKERNEVDPMAPEQASKETEEYGGFLLMMDTVPEKSGYDYGASYNRIWSTYLPRLFWPSKPYYGRDQWVKAWIAGSEFYRSPAFTGPAIGVLGATQLNGGAVATLIVLGLLGLLTRTAYDYYRFHADNPWAQAWWALTYYNAWLMTANDDPFVWFYYIYGHTTLIPMIFIFLFNRLARPAGAAAPAAWAGQGA